MKASPPPLSPLLSDALSNQSIAAQTVPDTVMAEQVSHNVVNDLQSTSGSPLVDVAANQNTIDPAADGAHDIPFLKATTDDAGPTIATNEQAINLNAHTSGSQSAPFAPASAADPSAGDVAEEVPEVPRIVADRSGLDQTNAGDALMVNGTHDAASSAEGLADDASMQGSVDVSLTSDTEGSRGDTSELKNDEAHHTRTNSVKKPITFSKVSVTKNFLAKSATTAPSVPKTSERPSPAGTPPQSSAARPRLIAKTGTTLRDVQKARLVVEGASGPDASKVWNKNRPVAPPPPRHLTDEELKQQYGIHLATRLQTEENGKESKWADIDDEEEDWAPESVVWMDGTKSTLTPQEAAPVQKEQKPATSQPPQPGDGGKPTLAVKKSTELGPMKTILKPGASAAAAQAKQNGTAAGTSSDKPSLKVKSSAPAPSKSPWAALPPVERISPINPPVQPTHSQPVPFAPQDARAYEGAAPPPAREIAADTFDRSWREGEGGARELFNSTNGRYEPAPEGRRFSVKPDSATRKPAVLQRPSPGAAAPAEPSAAFQTRTATQTDGSYGRRRGSSVSQGSLPPLRRMSVSKGSDLSPAPERRSSTVVGHDLRTSPKLARNEPAQPIFSQQTAWQQQMPPRPESSNEEEDPVKVQERVMREKREQAKKRREEEEKQLEAEKQERLRARLAQLEGAGKSRKDREAEAAAAVSQSPSVEKAPEQAALHVKVEEPQPQATNSAETATTKPRADGLSSLPTATDPEPAKEVGEEETLPSPIPPKSQANSMAPPVDQSQHQPTRSHLSPRPNARAPFAQQTTPYRPPTSSYSSPGDRKQQPFGLSPRPNNDTFSPWPTASNGNVWGTAGIGNGTFESANAFAPMPMSQQGSALPPPPGMGRPATASRISPQGLNQESRSPRLQQQSVAEPHRAFGPPGLEPRPDPFASQSRVNGASSAPGLGRQTHLPGPIAPPSRAQQPPSSNMRSQQRTDALTAWNNAAETLPHKYRAEADAAERKVQQTTPASPRNDVIKETFRQTSVQQGRLGGPRRYEKTEYTIHDAQGSRSAQSLSPAPPSAQTQPNTPLPTTSPLQYDHWKPAVESTVRIPDGSLNPAHGGLPNQQPPIAPPSANHAPVAAYQSDVRFSAGPLPPVPSSKDQSPPPPETVSHPVNTGSAKHPIVRLPAGKPVVKLPPAPSSTHGAGSVQSQTSAMMPQRPIQNWGAPASSRPIVQNGQWQERFNKLCGKTTVTIQTETPPSPPKTPPKIQGPALAVTSSTRTVMDELPASNGATVFLPQSKKATSVEGFTMDDSDDVMSKPVVEQMFNEELSFGSRPAVSIPREVLYETIVYNTPPLKCNLLDIGPLSGLIATEPQSAHDFNMSDLHLKRRDGYFVHLPAVKVLGRLVKIHNQARKPGFSSDRKPSARFNPKARGNSSVPVSPVTNGSPGVVGSRKTSFQKGPAPSAPESPTAKSASPSEAGRKFSHMGRPPRGPARRPPTAVKRVL